MSASSGPDRLLPAESFISCDPSVGVRLRTDADRSPDNYPPVSVPTLLTLAADKWGDRTALNVKRDGQYVTWTYREYLSDVRAVAKAFVDLGLEPRHGVAIIGFNSPEWFLADLAAVFAGGMAAGIYPTNNPEACRYIVDDCQANILVVEDEKQLAKFLPYRNELPHLKAIVQYTGTPKEGEGVLSWKELVEKGRSLPDGPLEGRLRELAINQCCHLVYTSGTTGQAKGVMLSHDNLTFTARRLCEIFSLRDGQERLVSYLPLSHVAANICDLFVMLTSAGCVTFADRDALKGTLTKTLRDALPTLFFGVPRVWEKIQERMVEAGKMNKGFKASLGQWAKRTGLEHNKNLLNGAVSTQVAAEGQSGSSLKYMVANKIVFQKVKAALGLNKCLRFYAAAAPISREVLEYFLSLDIRILEIYGMSECSGPQMSNTYDCQKLGTIGKELPGFWHKISVQDDGTHEGELMAKGRHVMMGYLHNKEKTEDVFDNEGWLKSGDLGSEDSDGFVRVTGRLKELLITAGGENVAPKPIEDAVLSALNGAASHAILVGDRRKFLACLIALKSEVDPETLAPKEQLASGAMDFVRAVGSKAETLADVAKDELVAKAVQEAIDVANNSAVSKAQRIVKWALLPQDFSLGGGELGPTMKVKRHVVLEKYKKLVDGLYP